MSACVCLCIAFLLSCVQCVWLPHESLVWVPATLLTADGDVCTFRMLDGEETTVKVDPTTLERVSDASIKGGLNNLVMLGQSCTRLRPRASRTALQQPKTFRCQSAPVTLCKPQSHAHSCGK